MKKAPTAKEPIRTRAERCERIICQIYGISNDDYVEMWHETGCRYAETHMPDNAAEYIRTTGFWMFWVVRWLDNAEQFIHWHNPTKQLADLQRMAMQSRKPGKLHRYFINKQMAQC